MKKLLSSLQGLLLLALPLVLVGCEDLATEDNPISAYLSINKAPVTIKVNDTFNREAIAVSGAVVEYTSSDTDVATVDEDGKVKLSSSLYDEGLGCICLFDSHRNVGLDLLEKSVSQVT